MTELDSLYQDIVMDHHRSPRGFSKGEHPLEGADFEAEGYNPMCGDRVRVGLRVTEGPIRVPEEVCRVEDIRFSGEGCSICLASASMMTEDVKGLTLVEARQRVADFRELMQGGEVAAFDDTDVEALKGVRRFPVRIKCALLAWTTLKEALEKRPA